MSELSTDERAELLQLRTDNAAYQGLLTQEKKRADVAIAERDVVHMHLEQAQRRCNDLRAENKRMADRLESMLLALTFNDEGRGGFDAAIVHDVWPEWRGAHARVHAMALQRNNGVHLG